MTKRLRKQLEELDPKLKKRLAARGFDAKQLERWAASIAEGSEARNLLDGEVSAVDEDAIEALPPEGSEERERLIELGAEVLSKGQLAICVLAGGMATRMGGVVKALVEVLPGKTFLDIRLAELAALRKRFGQSPPLWLMTSEPTYRPIVAALEEARVQNASCFEQFVSLRLDEEGLLFLDDRGEPSVYATGHGDLPDALRATPLLDMFRNAGGRYVWISNLDNLGATADLAMLGAHVDSGAELTVELAEKEPGDKGGGPVMFDGRPIIAENFRVPPGFDLDSVPVFNTNTFLVNADALAGLDMDWTYVMVEKKVDGRPAVQFERLIGEMTMAVEPRFQKVPREGVEGRFLPIKTMDDLEEARPTIAAIDAAIRKPAS